MNKAAGTAKRVSTQRTGMAVMFVALMGAGGLVRKLFAQARLGCYEGFQDAL